MNTLRLTAASLFLLPACVSATTAPDAPYPPLDPVWKTILICAAMLIGFALAFRSTKGKELR